MAGVFGSPTGVLRYDKEACFNGYTLVPPYFDKNTYLINMEGEVVHTWNSQYFPGLTAYLQPDGVLVRGGRIPDPAVRFGGIAGAIEKLDWDGNVLWEFVLNNEEQGTLSHNFTIMPNGHILAVAERMMSPAECIAKGRDPHTMRAERFEDKVHVGVADVYVVEIDLNGKIIYEWHVWDHLGTGLDQWDINWRLPEAAGGYSSFSNWLIFNGIEYNATFDEFMVTSRCMSEIYIIDRKSGHMIWRWGNPSTHGRGRAPSYCDDGDQKLWGPHNASYLPNGNILVHDNGWARPQGQRSRVLEINRNTGDIVWQYQAQRPMNFHSPYQSGAQRLPNGNTMVCATAGGQIFEVTGGPNPHVVWEFISPWMMNGAEAFLDDSHSIVTAHRTRMYPENHMQNMIHRARRYALDYPGLAGRSLRGNPVPGIQRYWEMEPWKSGYDTSKKRQAKAVPYTMIHSKE